MFWLRIMIFLAAAIPIMTVLTIVTCGMIWIPIIVWVVVSE